MAKAVRKVSSENSYELQPKFRLSVYSFDYFILHNHKTLEREHGLKLVKSENVPINFRVHTLVGYSDQEKLIQIQVKIIIQTTQQEKTHELAEMQIAFDFSIDNYESFNNNFPERFLRLLVTTAIATSRGLLGAKLSNTYLQNLIMPMIYPQKAQVLQSAPTIEKKS